MCRSAHRQGTLLGQMKKLNSSKKGVFLADADMSLVIATYTSIASQFGQSVEGSWLLTSYALGYIIALPVVGTYMLLIDMAFGGQFFCGEIEVYVVLVALIVKEFILLKGVKTNTRIVRSHERPFRV